MQQYKSAGTSINSTRVPAIFRKMPWKQAGKFYAQTNKKHRNVDIGGGKYDTATEYLERFHVENLIFDPYNRSMGHNIRVIGDIVIQPADSATLSNVLNVIKEEHKRIEILEQAKRWASITFISIYEGNKSGVGRITKTGCWQNNRRLADYIPEVQKVFKNIEMYNGIIRAW